MNKLLKSSTLLVIAATTLALGACNSRDDSTVGEKVDATINKTEQAAADAKAAVQKEAAEVKSDAGVAAERAKEAMAEAGEKLTDAGITASVNAELAKDSSLSALSINVDTTEGKVSLRGTAPSSSARDRATALARSIKGVKSVDNQLEVRA